MRISAGPFTDPRQLAAIDDLIAVSPEQIGLRFGRACCLEDLGRTGEAIAAYLDVLARDPAHFGALTNLGCLLFERERTADAEPYFRGAARLHPDDPVALVNLARLEAACGDTDAAIAGYEAVVAIDPGALHAHLGLADLFRLRGDGVRAQAHVDRAFATPRMWRFPCRSGTPSLRVLVLVSAAGGDLVMNRYLDDREVEATVVLADSVRAPIAFPEHDLTFNAIGDADRCRASLACAQAICAGLTAPVINDPAAVARTGRVDVMRRVRDLPGVRAPRTEPFARTALSADALRARGFTFPLLLRSPGHHAGMHFERVDDASALDAVVAALPGDDLLAIEFLDVRALDGNVRKYRAVIVDGRLYPAHLAIAPQWKVHYFSAAMSGSAASAAYRAEEEVFLADMAAVTGAAGMRALTAIGEVLGLDYAGVDFAIDRDGSIVVFEANATMAIYPPSGEAMWEYRRAPGERIVRAVATMMRARATSGSA